MRLRDPRVSRTVALVLIVVASLLGLLAIFAVWANRQLLNTENWTETSSELIENRAIRNQVGGFLVDELYGNVDVQGTLQEALPPRLDPLAGPAAGGLKELAERGAKELLSRPRPQALWVEANRRAHTRFLQVVEGGGEVVSTEGGEVTLDLKAMLGQTAERVGVGGRAQQAIPAGAAQITIMRSNQLALVQDVIRMLKTLAIVLVAASLALFALAVYVARGWRREALRASGIGLVLAGAAALTARGLAGDAVVDALATTEAVRPAAEAAWTIATPLLEEAATATIGYGVVVVLAAWIAGPTRVAIAIRRGLAPFLKERAYAYGALAVIVLLVLNWSPTPATRRVVPVLVLIGLLVAGLEALRRQTAREYPEADAKESLARGRERLAGLGSWVTGVGKGLSDGVSERVRDRSGGKKLDELERLAKLRDAGVLDAAEFQREKQRLLGPPAPSAGA
jgi:Short C-terminal domain